MWSIMPSAIKHFFLMSTNKAADWMVNLYVQMLNMIMVSGEALHSASVFRKSKNLSGKLLPIFIVIFLDI